jgi:NAD(P)-dependent dehydrogenase (short-subunit alcohol dehydrogenase family)
MEVRDRVAVVTGAASGIGRASALALARQGARRLVLADLDEDGLAETARGVADASAQALVVPTDVRDPDALERLFERADADGGGLDILHNNAGLSSGTPTWPEIAVERIAALVDVNLKAVLFGTRLALPRMARRGGGVIVNTASMAARTPLPPEAVYCATKAGVVMFTQSCASLRESHGVRVCCVCPGITETPMIHHTGPDGDGMAAYLQPVYAAVEPIPPERIAEAVLALIRDEQAAGAVVEVANEPRSSGRPA